MKENTAIEYANKVIWLKRHGYELNDFGGYKLTISVSRNGKTTYFQGEINPTTISRMTLDEIMKFDAHVWKRARQYIHSLMEQTKIGESE